MREKKIIIKCLYMSSNWKSKEISKRRKGVKEEIEREGEREKRERENLCNKNVCMER